MKTRYESKFAISFEQYQYLKNWVECVLERDNFSKVGAYSIFSQYYDSKNLKYYEQKLQGEYTHQKIRLRSYGKSLGKVFLESKLKHSDLQLKRRLEIPEGKCPIEFISKLKCSTSSFFAAEFLKYSLKLVCNVYYEREAFEAGFGTNRLRVTFDHNILCLDSSELKVKDTHFQTRKLCDDIIMEVKYDLREFPSILVDALRRASVTHSAFSKYGTSVERLYSQIDGRVEL